jgi:hypothetical protein
MAAHFQNLGFDEANTNNIGYYLGGGFGFAGPTDEMLPGWRLFNDLGEPTLNRYNAVAFRDNLAVLLGLCGQQGEGQGKVVSTGWVESRLQPAKACLLSSRQKLLHSRRNSNALPPEGGLQTFHRSLHALTVSGH